ncbi:MAG: adenylate/guanylate cyclase domain-containing protein [Actinomycetota bacterium]
MQVCPNCGRENADDARFCNACAHDLTGSPGRSREARKTVTVVFCDVSGSTALGERTDPESLRRVMTRYFEAMRSVLESHGGTVEKFIGDAVMAVFGIPQAHEDDALRGVRAAAEMHTALAALNEDLRRDHGVAIEIRIGVNTGEVIAGDPAAGHNVVTGDAVNTAARLEQSADAGDILIGDDTYALVRDAVVVEDVDPLDVKGKAAPLLAYRLLEVRPGAEGHARRLDSPMVGRERPLRMLRDTFDGVAADRACALFTVLGVAGIGKTRLTREFLQGVGVDGTADPIVVSGRCLPYGRGITFWPISEMLMGAAGISETDEPARVVERIRDALSGAPDADRVAAHLAELIGAGAGVGEVEPAWAVRRLFESLASSGPMVAYFDDIHWAEPGLLDVIEHVADFSRDAPILLLCTARPEFFDLRPGWGGGKLRATAVSLEPLNERESEELMLNLLSHPALTPEIRQRISEAAQGNPLFVEEMLQMLLDDDSIVEKEGEWIATVDLSTIHVPPAISALLTARLDRLPGPEREAIEAASVVGEVFDRAAVRALVPERSSAEVDELVTSLVRKDLAQPAPGGSEALRFRHLLVRDAAYGGMPKQRRAELHEAFGDLLEAASGDRAAEVDEVLGYHFEQAHALRAELGSPAGSEGVAARAAAALTRAGYRARSRGDAPATVHLLARAARLRPVDPARVELLIDLTTAAEEALEPDAAAWSATEALEGAKALGSEALLARAELARLWLGLMREQSSWEEAIAAARYALEVLEPLEDHRGLAEAWMILAWHAGGQGARYLDGIAAARIATEHAREAGDRTTELRAMGTQIGWLTWGPTPVDEMIARCDEVQPLVGDSRGIQAEITLARADAEAMSGHVERSRVLLAEAVATFEDLGQRLNIAFASTQTAWLVEWLAGDFAAVEEAMRRGIVILEQRGEHDLMALHRMMLGQAICAQGRFDEAEEIALECERSVTDPLEVTIQPLWRRVRALAASERGDHAEADRLSREALEIAGSSDGLFDNAWLRIERGQILQRAGRDAEATEAFEEAARVAVLKGDVVTAAQARRHMLRP